jgi:hypothetical protein
LGDTDASVHLESGYGANVFSAFSASFKGGDVTLEHPNCTGGMTGRYRTQDGFLYISVRRTIGGYYYHYRSKERLMRKTRFPIPMEIIGSSEELWIQ